MDKILFIDFNNFLWRASTGFASGFQGAPDENNKTEDEKDNIMIFNFFRNFRPIIELFKPEKCFIVMEGYPKFRYDILATYKANRIIKTGSSRQELNERFHRAKSQVVRILHSFPVTFAKADDYECDDVIGQLCENLKDEHLTIVTNDSDYIQTLQRGYRNIQIYNSMKKEFMMSPIYHYVQHKCLAGDKSDNIPGLLKPKKALQCALDTNVFKKFMSIEENRANFSINKSLIEFHPVPEEEILITQGVKNFFFVREEFKLMEFESITNNSSWKKYTETFDCLKY